MHNSKGTCSSAGRAGISRSCLHNNFLAGFEALLRGKKVTTVGAPFYSGWGLTDDRQQIARRDRKLSIEEIFAGAYILYPFYYQTNAELCSMEQAFKDVSTLTPDHYALQPQHTRWKLSGTYGLLGWRRLLTPLLSKIIEMVATEEDARLYRLDPAAFFTSCQRRNTESLRMCSTQGQMSL